MDSSGEQHLQIDHNIYKRRLDLSGQPIEEPKKEEIVTSTSVKTAEDAKEQTNITCGSCYGAAFNDSQCCNTCDDVKEAYRLRRWALPDLATIEQCKNDKSAGKSSLAFKEGCQIYGYMEVNRVGGSFHIAPGQSFTINHVHVHDVQPYSSSAFNTTHIIKHLSFGTDIQSANTAPLDGIKGLAKEAPEHAGDMGQIRMHYHQACSTIPARALLDTNTLYYDQYGHGDLTLWPISPSPYTPELHTIYVTLSPTYQYCKLKKS
ncbi:Endoplasmic reticulum-Golgi intermediate compartment protein 3 [Eumeta japonica]|uniref:Endoplasmic reticulum-Golgi intermediate compartment protein 3 n=1 Tax=Eumeta variegata TaxID=151549 RepID=A0A4C1U5G4_EUMVA|nr:Endoplasmic reticulum-Golgi intermediate compartment protein 3 [Eumeta japonica]